MLKLNLVAVTIHTAATMNNSTNASENAQIASATKIAKHDAVNATPSTGSEVALVGRYQAPAGVNFGQHHHVGHELIVWRTGQAQCRIGVGARQQVITTYPGMVSLMPGLTVHADVAMSAYSHVYVIFSSNLTLPGLEEPRVFSDDENGSLEHLLLSLEQEFNSEHSYRQSMVELLHQQIAVRLLRLGEQREISPAERLVQRLERLIEERYASGPSLEALAAELGTSPSNLRAKFSQLRTYSPKTYLTEVRVKHALGHIRSSSLSLEAIALMTGYASSSHLWRDVKHLTGMTPGSFRLDSEA
ncbi:helix-turn-helix domain-containing protein [Deinococcus altitudinis]|uniref:helix-turn-helix domain-containing protein n=1 Tax=Deinococcus altitudinis TaxID=468914 RepID=UPI0038926473